MAGRKPKITPEVERQLLQLLQAGCTKQDACGACGISDETLRRYGHNNVDFLERLRKAEAAGICEKVIIVSKAAKEGAWQAAAWFLERRRHEDWGRKDRMELTGKDRKPVEIDVRSYSREQLKDLRRILREPAHAARNGGNGAGGDEPP